MSGQALNHPDPAPVLGESRSRVLEVLRAAGEPVAVHDVAERSGLHRNTARFHLDGLVDAGLVEREAEDRSVPGRPRIVYRALVSDVPAGQRNYRLLAEMLTSVVADTLPEPDRAAVTAGEAWGRYLVDRPAPSQRIDAAEAVRRLSTVLADAGFAPGPAEGATSPVIPLRHCPFREIAEQHREVVCSLHLGLMRGALAEMRAPLVADRLDPLVQPSLCLAHLDRAPRRPVDAGSATPSVGRRVGRKPAANDPRPGAAPHTR
ncbi:MULTISPECIES: metalloregulator ArsR/SmtB family transcription factor [Micromonospora]|uniref:ArsR family transcriptional regulator n=1 Tax=Micromonospora solifontis TaxID=2487138 RepID=A0ABX9WH18_9ACTN|nr:MULTISPECIES: helix-turn-helix domain-containing protein [Micromonospora]NES16006.1 helix-turn-helix domain-containing protein [Micromonospora sp. PPF5-17B]NES36573.1 helix-turn-helix domain-containing protein [Micromonospora solifontis]NES57323.1 helix-turn-helix domain-containing protein [Micromonospora sp. PPF5-6]RNL99312.1 ArsR family transcriptional regulator [Micromonospora solifontis]